MSNLQELPPEQPSSPTEETSEAIIATAKSTTKKKTTAKKSTSKKSTSKKKTSSRKKTTSLESAIKREFTRQTGIPTTASGIKNKIGRAIVDGILGLFNGKDKKDK